MVEFSNFLDDFYSPDFLKGFSGAEFDGLGCEMLSDNINGGYITKPYREYMKAKSPWYAHKGDLHVKDPMFS